MFLKRFSENTISYKVFSSWPVMLLQVIVSATAFHLHESKICLYFMLSLIILMLLTCKDMTPLYLPIVLASMTVFANYGATPKDFMEIAPLFIVVLVLLVIKPFIFRTCWRQCKMIAPMIIVAIAITLGGLGYLTAEQYFKIVPMYYVVGLGFGLVIMYIYIMQYTLNDNVHNPVKILVKSMGFAGLMGILMIFPVVIEALIKKTDWSVQWSNNLSTMLILTMPFAFYMASKQKRFGIFYFIFGLLQALAAFLTLSRGGILFGIITAIISIIACVILSSKANRIIYTTLTLIISLTVLLLFVIDKGLLRYIEDLMNISPNEARVNMFKVAIDNFFKYPIFGTGLAFIGDFYFPQKWAIYWYHSTPFQIIGSMGIVGIVAYSLITFYRVRICIVRPSKFNVLATISLIGFELMALVNPGDFTPLPSMMMFTVILAVIEINNTNRVEKSDMLFDKINAGNWLEFKKAVSIKKDKQPPDYLE